MEKTNSLSSTFTNFPQLAAEENGGKTKRQRPWRGGSNGTAGFTIIELLVAIAVIAVLSSIVLVLTSGTKEKSRDSRRMEDMRQIQNALNLYYTNNNNFPVESSPVTITGTDSFSAELESSDAITEVPADPLYPSDTYEYTYETNSSGTTFTITFCLETNSIAGYSQGCSNTINP